MLGRPVDDHQRHRPVGHVWGDTLDWLRALGGLLVTLECDDYRVAPDFRNGRSFLFVVVEDGAVTELRLDPTEIRDCAVHEADEAAAAWCRERMRALSAPFGTDFERAGSALVHEVAQPTAAARRRADARLRGGGAVESFTMTPCRERHLNERGGTAVAVDLVPP
jgi:hypothetical protein